MGRARLLCLVVYALLNDGCGTSGTSGPSPQNGRISASNNAVLFPATNAGNVQFSNLTLSNVGDVSVQITAVTTSDPVNFLTEGSCKAGISLAAGGNCGLFIE